MVFPYLVSSKRTFQWHVPLTAAVLLLAVASCRELPQLASGTVDGNASHSPGAVDAASSCGNAVCDAGESCQTCPHDCNLPNGNACPRVGILYSTWHLPAYTAMQAVQQSGQPQVTLEDVLRSRVAVGQPPSGTVLSMGQVLPPALNSTGVGFFYQHHPARGFYCIYKRRLPGALNYTAAHEGTYLAGLNVADCPNVEATLADHAQQLTSAGVDHVVTDMSNFANFDAAADALSLRPLEVLTQTWRSLRDQGIATPDIAAWVRIPDVGESVPDGAMALRVLALYNAQIAQPLLLRDRRTGKRVLFYFDTSTVDPKILQVLQSNGGANDILTVPLSYDGADSHWNITAACQQGVQLSDAPCSQTVSQPGPLGTEVPVSPSYQSHAFTAQGEQIGYAGLPFGATGIYNGVTLRKQFLTALAEQPNYVLLASWNQHVAQPVSVAAATFTLPPPGSLQSLGLETDASAANLSFFDDYGAEFSRDLEPTVENGDGLYKTMSACVHLMKDGATDCSDADNLCCQNSDFSATYAFYNGGVSFGMFTPSVTPSADMQAMYLCNNVVQGTERCQGQGNGTMLGYASLTKGGGMLRTLLLCQQTQLANYNTLDGTCGTSGARATFVGYVR